MNEKTIDPSYLPVHPQIIRNDTLQSFDVFFQTGKGEMVLYCAGGKSVKEEVRQSTIEHNVKKLYIQKKDKSFPST